MERVLTAGQMRSCDRYAIDVIKIPGAVLMESAGRASFDVAMKMLKEKGCKKVRVFAGPGNNGGDGYVIARYFHNAKIPVTVISVKKPPEGTDAALNASIAARLGISVVDASGFMAEPVPVTGSEELIVDALLGTGLDREVGGVIAELIERINCMGSTGSPVLAVDIPSGLDSDNGRIMGTAVRADMTVSFGFLKRGLLQHPGAELCGSIIVADIGLPPEVLQDIKEPCFHLSDDILKRLPKYSPDAHKGVFGHLLIAAGSSERPGAAALVCLGALRTGAGLISLITSEGGLFSTRAFVPEAMGIVLKDEGPLGLLHLSAILEAASGKNAFVIGPGINRGNETGILIGEIIRKINVPLVLDADGINAVASDLSVLSGGSAPLILTPHPGEMERLSGIKSCVIQADRFKSASEFAVEHGVFVVLKGASTVIADPDGKTAVCTRGSSALATGGTGDILAGIIGALAASGISASDACRLGVYAHALAGEIAESESGRAGVAARDIAAKLGNVWKKAESYSV